MRPERRRPTRLAVLVLVLLFAPTACAGGGVAAPPATRPDTTEPTRPSDDPGFRVDGTQIVGPGGEPFVAQGVNLLGPQSFWDVPTSGLARAAGDWGLNAVRLNTCLPGGCDGADGAVHAVNDDLDALVQEFTGAGIVVILSLHQVEPGSMPDDAEFALVARWWDEVARRYSGNPHVWFNLLNEPGEGSPVPERWLLVHERLIDVVRAAATNVIVVDGTQYGQEAGVGSSGPVTAETSAILRHGEALQRRADNIVFSVHVYEQWAPPDSDPQDQAGRLRAFVEAVHAAGLPLIIGETGGPAGAPDGQLAQATRAAYQVAAEAEVGLLAWHGQARDDFALVESDDPDTTFGDGDEVGLTWHGQLLTQLVEQRSAGR
jgi:mannan endo-1,4-beta-mannosidase